MLAAEWMLSIHHNKKGCQDFFNALNYCESVTLQSWFIISSVSCSFQIYGARVQMQRQLCIYIPHKEDVCQCSAVFIWCLASAVTHKTIQLKDIKVELRWKQMKKIETIQRVAEKKNVLRPILESIYINNPKWIS